MFRHFPLLLKRPASTIKQPVAIMCSSGLKNELCQIKEDNGVREIILNDPNTRNALSLKMMDEVLTALNKNWDNIQLRCIVLSSTGPIWSSGHDLKELMPECGAQQHAAVFEKLKEIVYSIRKAPVPVIAKVNGKVAAGGVQLVASCDIIVCSETSSFVMPSANFGVFASTPAVALSSIMSHAKLLDMLMTGHSITAEEASKRGLASRVVPEDQLNKEIKQIVDAIKDKSRAVLALGKEFFYKQAELLLEESYELGTKKMVENLQLKDTHEGLRGFMAKSKPKWNHF